MRAGAELPELRELRRVLGRQADDIEDAAVVVARRIGHFRDVSTQYIPPLPPHHARGVALADRLDALGRRVASTHEAFAAADRWAVTTAAMWLHDRQDERATLDDARHAGAEVWARWRHSVRTGEDVAVLGHADFLRPGVGHHFADAGWRHQLADSARDLQHVLGRADTPHQPAPAASGRVARALERFRGTRAGSAVRLGGRALGVAGVALSGVDIVEGLRSGDEERVATGTLGAVAGVAMMSGFPPAQLAGALVTGGLLVYEYREEISARARTVGRGVRNAATAAADFVTGLF